MIPAAPPTSAPRDNLGVLIYKAQNGDEEAARLVYDRCREPLLSVIRGLLRPRRRLRTLFDSDDFLIDTFTAIFSHHFSAEVAREPKDAVALSQEDRRKQGSRRRPAAPGVDYP